MTDDEEFTAILAAFPIDSRALDAIYKRADALLGKTQNSRRHGGLGDGTLKPDEWYKLRTFVWALRDLRKAVARIEGEIVPYDDDEDIPF